MRRSSVATLAGFALALSLAACSSKDPHTLLVGGHYSAAAERFEKDIAALEPGSAGWMEAKQGHIAALAHCDRARATKDALELLKTHGAALGERGIYNFALQLKQTGGFEVALELLEATVDPWPVSKRLDTAHSVVLDAFAKSDTSEAAVEKLKSLGYVGGGGRAPHIPRPGSKTPKEEEPAPRPATPSKSD